MIDIKLIREEPERVIENIKKRFKDEKIPLVDKVKRLDEEWRKLKFIADNLRRDRNKISEQISDAKKSKDNKTAERLIKEAKDIPEQIKEIEEKEEKLEKEIDSIMKEIPNMIHETVPIGKSDKENIEIKKYGKPKKFDFEIKSHVELGEELGLLDFETSAETTGKGFYFIKGKLALLNMALINYARDIMVQEGFEYVEPPLMIKKEVLDGVYSTAEIDAMAYKIEGEDLYMIATSEHPLIGQFINKTLQKKDLPTLQTGYSMCFRKEIGSHGIDEKGIYRTHQFNKQEMVVICEPEESYIWYDKLLNISIKIFKELEIPFRILECCSGDLADLKAKSCDLEAWSPRRDEYFEITSLTNMESAQARRLKIRINDGKNNYFAHTLNNTVIATSRALVAIIENFQNKDGSIDIPKALHRYTGFKKIEKIKK